MMMWEGLLSFIPREERGRRRRARARAYAGLSPNHVEIDETSAPTTPSMYCFASRSS